MVEGVLQKTDDLVARKYRELFMPTLLSSFSHYFGNILNGVIVSNLLGLDKMAAIYACMPLSQIGPSMAQLLSAGAAGMISIAAAAREHKRADYIFSTVLTITLIIAVLLPIVLLPAIDSLTVILSAAPELRDDMREYLPLFIFHNSLMLCTIVLRYLLKGEGFARIVGWSVVLQQGANVILTVLFVSKFNWGMAGASGALLIGDVLGMICMLANYLVSRDRGRNFVNVFADGLKKFFTQSLEVIRSGGSAALLTTLIAIKVWILYRLLGEYGGAEAMSCYAICITLWAIGGLLTSACVDSAMPIVSTLFSEKDYGSVRTAMKLLQKYLLALIGALIMIIVIYPEGFLSLYGVDEARIEMASRAVTFTVLSLVGTELTFMMVYYYTILQQRRIALMLSILEGFVAVVPSAFLLSSAFGVDGVWYAFLASTPFDFLLVLYYSRVFGTDVFLIEKIESDVIYDVSLVANEENASKISVEAIEVLKGGGVSTVDATRVGVALEEMTVNIATLAVERAAHVDVRIKYVAGEGVIIVIRDDGMPFNPLLYRSLDNEGLLMDEVEVLNALARDVKYNRVLGLNQTIIEI